MIKTKDNINIKNLDYVYYINNMLMICKIDLKLEKEKSINNKYHALENVYINNKPYQLGSCTMYLFQYLNNTLEKETDFNGFVGDIKPTIEFAKAAASCFYSSIENLEKERKPLIDKYFKNHVKVKDLLEYLSKFNKEHLVHFYNDDPEYGSYYKNIEIENISNEIVISNNPSE